ncbi:MAG: hypothetical protein ACK4HV_02245 [Parachlamydiaceae bacterium]
MFHDYLTSIQKNEKKEKELLLKNEAIDREIESILPKELLDKVATFTSNETHFSEEEWQKLNEERKKLDLQLRREIDNILSPLEKARKQKERNISSNWLFVK